MFFISGRYMIERILGEGGMSVVYLARDTHLQDRWVALKRMELPQLPPAEAQLVIAAFQREAQLLATLQHPAIVPVSDYFEEGGSRYLVMDYVAGQTLEQAWQTAGRFSEGQVLIWARQLAEALHFLHHQNPPIIFRDLKPANIMLRPDGSLVLIDFGIARFFKAGQHKDTMRLGTPGYAAPEQYGRGQSDSRADVYSLGVVLHQLLTGHDPAQSPMNLPAVGQLAPACSPQVAAAIDQALQLDPGRRFQSVAAFLQALEQPGRTGRPKGSALWQSLMLVFLLVSGMAAGLWLWGRLASPTLEPTAVVSVPAGITPLPPSPTPISSPTIPNATPPIPPPSSTPTPAATPTPTLIPTPTSSPGMATRGAAIVAELGQYRPVEPLVVAAYDPGRVVIDGQLTDWPALPYALSAVVYGDEHWTGPADLSGRMAIAWNEQYLLLAVIMEDDLFAQDNTGISLYLGDSLDFWLDVDLAGDFTDSEMSSDDYQIGISPGNFGALPAEMFLWRPLSQAGNLNMPLAVRQMIGGYQFEFGLAWSTFGTTPVPGRAYGFTLCLSDNDRPGTREQQTMVCLHATRIWGLPTSFGTLVLIE